MLYFCKYIFLLFLLYNTNIYSLLHSTCVNIFFILCFLDYKDICFIVKYLQTELKCLINSFSISLYPTEYKCSNSHKVTPNRRLLKATSLRPTFESNDAAPAAAVQVAGARTALATRAVVTSGAQPTWDRQTSGRKLDPNRRKEARETSPRRLRSGRVMPDLPATLPAADGTAPPAAIDANDPPAQPPMSQEAMELLRTLTQALAVSQTASLPPPEFSGRPHECPDKFIQDMECYLQTRRIHPDAHVRTAIAQLHGDAAIWCRDIAAIELPFATLCSRLRQRYASDRVLARLAAELHNNEQALSEPAELFIRRKGCLARRLQPQIRERTLVETIVGTLHPRYRRVLRFQRFETLEELSDAARELEADFRAEMRPRSTPPSENRARSNTATTEEAAAKKTAPRVIRDNINTSPPRSDAARRDDKPTDRRPLPQCQFCPERHWHRNCPVALSGNERAAGPSERAVSAVRK